MNQQPMAVTSTKNNREATDRIDMGQNKDLSAHT